MGKRLGDLNQEQIKGPSLFGMITSPVEQFERIKSKPKIWVPMLLITLLFLIGTYFLSLSLDINELIGEEVPSGQVEIVKMVTLVTMVITGVLSPVVSVLISSAVLLAVAKIANSEVSFKQIFSMKTFIYLITAIGLFLNGLIRLLIGGNPEVYVTSLAGLLNSDSKILGVFEVFTIWATVLIAIGLNKVANLSKGVAVTIAIIFFLFQIGMAFIGSLFSGISGM
ncbi:Yip1 family protein [Peribacillus sp. NPDC097197]|uniref:Yip1 family protein n=1 Tax=Peribacillus sp. NPDC097197 TaxID=3390615 RepID=UPI003D072E68